MNRTGFGSVTEPNTILPNRTKKFKNKTQTNPEPTIKR